MTEIAETVTDAYVFLQAGSRDRTLSELLEVLPFPAQECIGKGDLDEETGRPASWTYANFSTEGLSSSRDLNEHFRILSSNIDFEKMDALVRGQEFSLHAVVYWWTSSDTLFDLNTESLKILAEIGVPVEFNLMSNSLQVHVSDDDV